MKQLDRYILSQLLGPFGFFALVFTGVLWLSQSLRMVDTLISNKQSALTFLELSSLILPNVMLFVFPFSAFAATLYTLNRLYVDSELVVVLMSGRSPWSLVRPLLVFGAGAMVALLVITLFLLPISRTQLADRLLEIKTEVKNSLVVEGQFIHPTPGVAVFIRDTNASGEMAGIFIHDARREGHPVTYSAKRALLVADDTKVQLVMFEGVAQRLSVAEEIFSTVSFGRFVFDMSEFILQGRSRNRKPNEYFLWEGLDPDPEVVNDRWTRGHYVSEAHEKLSTPLLTFVLPLLALGSILAGSFRRGGFTWRMVIGVVLLMVVQVLAVLSKSAVEEDWRMWPVSYMPVMVTILISVIMIQWSARTRRAPKLKRLPV